MEIHFIDLDLWERMAERRIPTDAQEMLAKDASGFSMTIRPGLTLHRELTVLGRDWIPVRRNGYAALEQMTMTPGLHLRKSPNIVQESSDRFVARPARTRRIEDDAVLVGGHENDYHWLIGYLPRLLFALAADVVGTRKLLLNANLTPLQRQALDLVGVDARRLLPIEDDEAVTLPSVVVPNMLTHTTVCHPLLRKLLREEFVASPGLRPRRVYVMRGSDAAPQLANEPQLLELLARWGFAPHRVDTLDFQSRIDLFAAAEAVVGVHDPLLANIVFCEPVVPLFEICNREHAPTSMRMVALAGRLQHVSLPADTVAPAADGNPLLGTWSLDLAATEKVLRRQLGEPFA